MKRNIVLKLQVLLFGSRGFFSETSESLRGFMKGFRTGLKQIVGASFVPFDDDPVPALGVCPVIALGDFNGADSGGVVHSSILREKDAAVNGSNHLESFVVRRAV